MDELIYIVPWFVLGAIVVFLLIREVVTWYWKINDIVDSLDRIDRNLEYIAALLKEQNPEIAKKIEVMDIEEC